MIMQDIATSRLLLRPLVFNDAEPLHALLDLDPQVWRLDPGYSRTLAARRADIGRRIAQYAVLGFGSFAAIERETGTLIGQGGLNSWLAEGENGDRTLEFEIMYGLGSSYWGRGFGTELAFAWVRYAFEQIRIARLLVGPARSNFRSIRVLEKIGFLVGDDPFEPNCVLALLTRRDWLQRSVR